MIKLKAKHSDRCHEGMMDRPSQDLSSYHQGLISTSTVNWHLKVKKKKCDLGLIKNYCITVSMQKFSSIHKLIQQILGSHKLNDNTHF